MPSSPEGTPVAVRRLAVPVTQRILEPLGMTSRHIRTFLPFGLSHYPPRPSFNPDALGSNDGQLAFGELGAPAGAGHPLLERKILVPNPDPEPPQLTMRLVRSLADGMDTPEVTAAAAAASRQDNPLPTLQTQRSPTAEDPPPAVAANTDGARGNAGSRPDPPHHAGGRSPTAQSPSTQQPAQSPYVGPALKLLRTLQPLPQLLPSQLVQHSLTQERQTQLQQQHEATGEQAVPAAEQEVGKATSNPGSDGQGVAGAQPSTSTAPPMRIEVTVAVRGKVCGSRAVGQVGGPRADEQSRGGYVRGSVCGLMDVSRYLEGRDCILYTGRWMSRSHFEKVGGSKMAKWYRSIRVLPDLEPLGEWLERHGMPVSKGPARRSSKRPALDSGDDQWPYAQGFNRALSDSSGGEGGPPPTATPGGDFGQVPVPVDRVASAGPWEDDAQRLAAISVARLTHLAGASPLERPCLIHEEDLPSATPPSLSQPAGRAAAGAGLRQGLETLAAAAQSAGSRSPPDVRDPKPPAAAFPGGAARVAMPRWLPSHGSLPATPLQITPPASSPPPALPGSAALFQPLPPHGRRVPGVSSAQLSRQRLKEQQGGWERDQSFPYPPKQQPYLQHARPDHQLRVVSAVSHWPGHDVSPRRGPEPLHQLHPRIALIPLGHSVRTSPPPVPAPETAGSPDGRVPPRLSSGFALKLARTTAAYQALPGDSGKPTSHTPFAAGPLLGQSQPQMVMRRPVDPLGGADSTGKTGRMRAGREQPADAEAEVVLERRTPLRLFQQCSQGTDVEVSEELLQGRRTLKRQRGPLGQVGGEYPGDSGEEDVGEVSLDQKRQRVDQAEGAKG